MRIASVRIQNFRAFADTTVHFNDYTCIAGPNGGGKSTVLNALNVFFRETAHSQTNLLKLEAEDFHRNDTNEPIRITVTFDRLSDEAKEDFKDYVRQEKLIVSAEAKWDAQEGCAPVSHYGERLGLEEFAPFFKAVGDNKPVKELKDLYAALRQEHAALAVWSSKEKAIASLRELETAQPNRLVLLRSDDEFYGASKGAGRLNKYVQWIFVPAVKDASIEGEEEKRTVLGALLERTVRSNVNFKELLDKLREEIGGKYRTIVDGQQAALKQLSDSLEQRLRQWAHPDASLALEWKSDDESSLRIAEPIARVVAAENAFRGTLSRFGHGLQRSFLLALLEELSGRDAGPGPTLILGCEEPELYQHPPQARHLATVFQRLAEKNSQVMVCTHSPYFVSGRGVEDIRLVRCDHAQKRAVCRAVTFEQVAASIAEATGKAPIKTAGIQAKLAQTLQPELNELFFTGVLVLVEGLEDVAYISTYLTLTDQWDEFRKLGGHIVPAGRKSSLLQPLVIARSLKIPTFLVFDGDTDKGVAGPSDDAQMQDRKARERSEAKVENTAILKLWGMPGADPLPHDTLWADDVVMWSTNIGAVVTTDVGTDNWAKIAEAVRAEYDMRVGDFKKNGVFIGYCLAKAWEGGMKSPNLEKLCNAIIKFAKASRAANPIGAA